MPKKGNNIRSGYRTRNDAQSGDKLVQMESPSPSKLQREEEPGT